MKELLFSCKSEKLALENVLAFNQIRKCDEGIDKYNEEIVELKEEIRDILKGEGITENYVDLISNYKREIKELDTGKSRVMELDKKIKCNEEKIDGFNIKIKELESELEAMKRVIFDSDDAKVIVETQNKIELTNKRLSDLYDLVENLNNDNTTILIEKEFIKNKSFESDFNTPEVVKVEISNELERITIEFENVIKELDLAVREDIEFCMKKINNREKEIAKFEDRKYNIIAEYPDAEDLDFDSEIDKLDNLFEELDSCFGDFCSGDCSGCAGCDHDELECGCDIDACSCGEECECTLENNCGCSCAIEKDIEEDIDNEEDLIDAKDVDITTDMVHVESIEKPEIELKEVEEASELMSEDNSEVVIDENDEEEINVEFDDSEDIEIDDSNSFSTIGSVPYIFSEGESLESIAEKVYPSKDCWEAIYNYNKEEIDSYLTANGISCDEDSIKTLAADKYLFAGIQLNIPTDANYKG